MTLTYKQPQVKEEVLKPKCRPSTCKPHNVLVPYMNPHSLWSATNLGMELHPQTYIADNQQRNLQSVGVQIHVTVPRRASNRWVHQAQLSTGL